MKLIISLFAIFIFLGACSEMNDHKEYKLKESQSMISDSLNQDEYFTNILKDSAAILDCKKFIGKINKLSPCKRIDLLSKLNNRELFCLGDIILKFESETNIASQAKTNSILGLYYDNLRLYKQDLKKWKTFYKCQEISNNTDMLSRCDLINHSAIWHVDIGKKNMKEYLVKGDSIDFIKNDYKKLVVEINNENKVKIKLVKVKDSTVYVKITNSTYFTQRLGDTGADWYIASVLYTLTESGENKYVNFDFVEGDSGGLPGKRKREDITGKQISEYQMNNASSHMEINDDRLNNGVYFYQIRVNDRLVQADKLIIIR